MYAVRAADPDRWLAGMDRLQPRRCRRDDGQRRLMRAWQVPDAGRAA